MAQGGFYIEHDGNGQPYLGFQYDGPGMSVRIMLADKMSVAGTRETFLEACRDLMKTPEKLIAAEGGILDGLRKPQGG